MKMRIKNLLVAVLALAMLATGMTGTDILVKAAAGPIKVTNDTQHIVKPGETSHIKMSIVATDIYVPNPAITIKAGDNAPFTFSNISMHMGLTEVDDVATGTSTELEFDVKVNESAKIGEYPVAINFAYSDAIDRSDRTASISTSLTINEEKTPAQLTVGKVSIGSSVIGNKTDLSFVISNEGQITAKNAYFSIDFGDSIERNYTLTNIKVGDLEPGKSEDFSLPVNILSTATAGRKTLVVNFTYKTPEGTEIKTVYNVAVNLSDETKTAPKLSIENITCGGNLKPGDNFDVSVDLKNIGRAEARNIIVKVDEASVNGTDIIKNYFTEGISVANMKEDAKNSVKVPLSVSKYTAAGGLKGIKILVTYTDKDGKDYTVYDTVYADVKITTITTKAPKLSIENITYGDSLKPGDNFNVTVDLKNTGETQASNVIVKVDDASVSGTDIIKNYFTEGIAVDNMVSDAEKSAKVPLSVSKYATTGGLKAVKILVSYTDKDEKVYSVSDTVYVDVKVDTVETGKPNLIISSVTQNPANPVAGDKVEISFELENKSNIDVTELKLTTSGLTEATFIPVHSDPYQYIEKLKGGDKIKVTIPLIISKLIPEGLNNITLNMTYDGGGADPVTIPVKNIQNETGTISKPKLIVSKYSTDVEELRAGKTFNFTFDIYNTNAVVAAKNITVTVNQPENVFTATQGSNSFFINKIEPGETVSNTLEMKVKSDASTKAYTLEILIEYEYDGAEPNPTTGEIGEKRTEKLNLQAIENSRPVVNNPNVYSWEGMVTVGSPATMSFEFYNMGRSPLNNVIVYVEGDFTKSDGNMYFIGNAAEGSSTYVEFDVIPNVVGTAKGTLRVTFEDSNGDTQEFTQEFSQEVMDAGSMVIPGDMGDGSGEVFNPGVPVTAKKAIVPIWAFVLIQAGIFILFVPITRKIIISAYRSKLRKKDQEQY